MGLNKTQKPNQAVINKCTNRKGESVHPEVNDWRIFTALDFFLFWGGEGGWRNGVSKTSFGFYATVPAVQADKQLH